MHKKSAFMLAATHSGAGKTTITLGLLRALQNKGMSVQPFKCGPDFIDPTLHHFVTGKNSRNLDLKMCGSDYVKSCFDTFSIGADICLVEGVMGLFDGGSASSASLAKVLSIPVILVVDVKASAESVAAIVKGFESLDLELTIYGVILNRIGSPRHRSLIEKSIAQHCTSPVLGILPRDPSFSIPDRHLGLFMGDEQPLSNNQLEHLAKIITENIDLDRLVEICTPLPSSTNVDIQSTSAKKTWLKNLPQSQQQIRIGLALDKAFCFYYQDNLDILQSLGAEIVPFSPLSDPHLPEDIDALYLGGGYPELHSRQLSENVKMRDHMIFMSEQGLPIFAECGGFMYLTQGIVDRDENFWPMAGIFPVRSKMKDRLSRLGYREVVCQSNLFGAASLFGHEFHYSEIEEMPQAIKQVFNENPCNLQGFQVNNTMGSYLHIHLGRSKEVAQHFITFCKKNTVGLYS